MARLYRSPSGVWYVSWNRKERQSLRTKDAATARLAARRLERERADPAHAAAAKETIRSCLKALVEDKVAHGRAEGTLHMIGVKSGHLARLLGDETPLVVVDAEACDRYLAARVGEGAGLGTIGKELGVLRGALKLARRRGKYSADPATVIPHVEGGYTPRTTWLTESQVTALLDELQPHRARHVAWLAVSGARLGESLRADRADVSGGRILIRGTKTRLSWRTVEVPEYARPLLERALVDAPRSGLLHRPWGSIRRDLAAACERAGVPVVTPNDLRRTCAQWLRQRGVDASLVAQYLGHTDARMVERVYGRLGTRELADAIGARVDSSRARTMRVLAADPRETGEIGEAMDRLQAALSRANQVARDGIEPPTRGFSSLVSLGRNVRGTGRSRGLTLARLRVLVAANDVVTAWRAAS